MRFESRKKPHYSSTFRRLYLLFAGKPDGPKQTPKCFTFFGEEKNCPKIVVVVFVIVADGVVVVVVVVVDVVSRDDVVAIIVVDVVVIRKCLPACLHYFSLLTLSLSLSLSSK